MSETRNIKLAAMMPNLHAACPPLHRRRPHDCRCGEAYSTYRCPLIALLFCLQGNHELYNFSVAKDVHEHFAPRWNGRYLTSNVNITLPDTFSPTGLRSRPIGSLLAKFETPVLGLRVTALGVIFNFRSAAPGLTVQDPATMVEEKWFADAIDEAPDVFLIAGHIPVRGDPGFAAVHAAIRKRHPTVPIAMLGGHSHVRDCVQLDPLSMSLESGRYLETIGWMSISGLHGEQDVRFARKYIDANRRNYAFHANLSTPDFDTRHGKHISWTMRAIADEWNLTRLHGIAPQDVSTP